MKTSYLLFGLIIVAIVILAMVPYHSVEEIHYLKSFFPRSFTVEEAMQASVIELVKVFLISLPLIVIVFVCLSLLKHHKKK